MCLHYSFATLLCWVIIVFVKVMTRYIVIGLWYETNEVHFHVKEKLDSFFSARLSGTEEGVPDALLQRSMWCLTI